MTDGGDCGAIGEMKIGRGNRSTRRKPTPVPLDPLQILDDLTGARTRAAAVGSQRLTARAMARPKGMLTARNMTCASLTVSIHTLDLPVWVILKPMWRNSSEPYNIPRQWKVLSPAQL
jgi:hypothetical protein